MLSLTGRLGRRRLRETCAPACKSRKAACPATSSTSSMASRRSTAKVPCWQTSRRPAPKPSCSRARCCETAAASSGITASGSCASWTPPAIRSVPSHSRPIALKGAVTAFLEAMLGGGPRLGVSLALIIAHEDQRPSLATGGRPDPTGGARAHGETCRGGARAHGLRRGGRTTHPLIGALSGEREALADLVMSFATSTASNFVLAAQEHA